MNKTISDLIDMLLDAMPYMPDNQFEKAKAYLEELLK